ncbi:MAG: MBL fold metallo-hydrolase [SAR202 cluster bacterium]|nr:MBL fold metallo-hydrolase [SAR202 cluster bacterium]
MTTHLKRVETVRQGSADGRGMVLRLTTKTDVEIYVIAVPPDNDALTGPTWSYLFKEDALTLIDPGPTGSFHVLGEGIQCTGYKIKEIERIIITHGHADHDGSVAQLVDESGAELWAHDIYSHLLPFDPRDIQLRPTSSIKQEMARVVAAQGVMLPSSAARHSYLARRRRLEVNHPIQAMETSGSFTFFQLPGHSPDHICVTFDGLVFTGDHVLPEISPHPTMKTQYAPEVKQGMPARYHDENQSYGLARYLRSLKVIVELGEDVGVMPAHRLFNKNKLNFDSALRAEAIIQHHTERLGQILERIGNEPASLESVTRRTFEHRKLAGRNLFAALTEVVAHVEFLEDAGDLEVTEDGLLRRTGRDNYHRIVQEIAS